MMVGGVIAWPLKLKVKMKTDKTTKQGPTDASTKRSGGASSSKSKASAARSSRKSKDVSSKSVGRSEDETSSNSKDQTPKSGGGKSANVAVKGSGKSKNTDTKTSKTCKSKDGTCTPSKIKVSEDVNESSTDLEGVPERTKGSHLIHQRHREGRPRQQQINCIDYPLEPCCCEEMGLVYQGLCMINQVKIDRP
ncbi:hypothetical protein FNV43_RR11996 [Rhamnella rubrinervis]|uniref:Uncharacterized protein n=1 Tax=Rhamnella rubrinervis TaxID=2594499 RepID=A0A8K0H6U4_9ROSA|nr:hypothetical protein FNV43_RR11996 [Rhamnella rubrinervis]